MSKLDRLAIITLVIALALIFAGVGYYFTRSDAPEEEPAENAQEEREDEEMQFRRFATHELGFSFEYPAEWGDAELVQREGGQGGAKATIEFSNINWFTIGSITEDFAEGRGGTPTDTQGFGNEDGIYFFKFVSTSRVPIDPVKSIETGLGEVVIVDHSSFVGNEEPVGPVMTVGAGNLGALVNLDGEAYSGVIFLNTNTAELSADAFEDMLMTLQPE